MNSYGSRLQQVVADRGALCVGIDPHPAMLRDWGLPVDARGLERCARTMVEALGDVVAVFKPQSAFFEAHGSAGIAVLERTLADIAGTGALALLDVKRGDIGSTMDAYAAAYLSDGSPLAADAITVSPYLGFGSLAGAIDLARRQGRGVYVLALTSNPEGPQVQLAQTSAGPHRRPDGRRRGCGRQRRRAGRASGVGRAGGRRHRRPDRSRLLPGQRLDPGPGLRRPGRDGATIWPRCSGPRSIWCCRRPAGS